MSPRRAAAALLLLALPVAGCAGTAAPAAEGTAASVSDAPATGAPTGTTPAPAPPEAAGQRIEVAVAGGRVTGDTGRVPVSLGEPVTVVVTSDVADEVHLHGYDRLAELVPGQPAELAFDATIPGVFELELHDAGTVLLTLQVG